MNTLFFWNTWKKPYKVLYLSLLAIFLIALVLYTISYFIGIDAMIRWETKSLFDSERIPGDTFIRNLFSYSVDVNNYLIREKFNASDIQVRPAFAYIYFSVIMIAMVTALTVLTRVGLVWYGIGMGLFIFFLVLLHTEIIGVFGATSQKFTLLAILLYGAVSFYFQAYDEKFSFLQRWLTFVTITIALGLIIHFTSAENYPFLFITNYGLVIPVILTMIFIVAIAFDIITGFLFITSGSSRVAGKRSLLHFSIISSLYLINLLLIYLKKKAIITGDFLYIDVLVIYIFSALLGIWGLKKRATLFTSIISVSNASLLYISFAIIATSTITYSMITGNDPLTEAFQYAILYSHLGIGVVFFLYILYNFWELFYRNVSAYDLVYEPRRMPFFMVRPLGMIIILSLFMQSGMVAYKLTRAGYYNSVGDIYLHAEKYEEAKEAYTNGSTYGFMNHRSNYALATVLTRLNEKDQAALFYLKSLDRNPSEYAYANLANLYMEGDQFFRAFFTLKDGMEKFPKSGTLHNNMAILYSTKAIWDSTLFHLQYAKDQLKEKGTVASNFIWFLGRNKLYQEADSLLNSENFENHLAFQTNKIALHNLGGKKNQIRLNEDFLKDSLLTGYAYCYLYNYSIANLKTADLSLVDRLDSYLKYEGNLTYADELILLKILKLYYSGKRADAILELKNLTATAASSSALLYNKISGLWALEQRAYPRAADFFRDASSLLDPESQLRKAVVLLESGYFNEGLNLLQQLKNTPQIDVKNQSDRLVRIFSTKDLNEVKKWNDTLKFQFLHFRKHEFPEEEIAFGRSSGMFLSNHIKLLWGADLMKYYLDHQDTYKAESVYNNLKDFIAANKKNSAEVGEVNLQVLRLYEAKKEWKELQQTSRSIFLNESENALRPYFQGVAELHNGQEKHGIVRLDTVLQSYPYLPDAFIITSEYYSQKNDDQKAYEILIQGLNFNKHSAELHMAYALQATKMNLTDYAEETLDRIKELTTSQEFNMFKKQYDQEKAAAEKRFLEF